MARDARRGPPNPQPKKGPPPKTAPPKTTFSLPTKLILVGLALVPAAWVAAWVVAKLDAAQASPTPSLEADAALKPPRVAKDATVVPPPLLPTKKHAAHVAEKTADSNSNCRDEHQQCATWASAGECELNAGFMENSCPVSCDTCRLLGDRKLVCKRDWDTPAAIQPGGVNRMFEGLVETLQPTHAGKVHVMSSPPEGPWVVVIDDFLEDFEVDALLEKGGHHFERSLAGDQVTRVRTSKTSWCNVASCESDPTIRRVKKRVSNLTGVPLTNSEHIQVLQYEVGDFYREHHDQNARPRAPWGPRLFTFFLYLSDVEEGGGTRFRYLNITVEPKRGRALVWPSVFDDDPDCTRNFGRADQRTTHEALPVTAGRKYAANMWLHQYDFQRPLAAGCKNEDDALCGDCLREQDREAKTYEVFAAS